MAARLVLTTTAKKSEAQKIARTLVRERLAACVSLLPNLESHYAWEGKLQKDRETLLLIKTTARRVNALTRRIKELHSYTVPEIIALPITGGNADYLKWLTATVGR